MDAERILEIMYEVIDGRRLVDAGKRVLSYRTLTPAEHNYATFLYKKSLAHCRKKGLLSEKEILREAIMREDWDPRKEALITLYKREIDTMEKSLHTELKYNKARQRKVKLDITKRRKDLEDLEDQRSVVVQNSAEYTARIEKNNYILSRITLDEFGNQVWSTYQDFQEEEDAELISLAIRAWNFVRSYSETEIRAIAKSPTWNVMWNSCKDGKTTLFNKPSSEYTQDQLLLSYWSMVYDSVYESLDRPSQDIIEDDDKLDVWLEEQKKERDKETKRNTRKRSSRLDKHPELFVMAKTDAEADSIYENNSEQNLGYIRKEIEKLKEKEGQPVSELELRYGRIKLEFLKQKAATKH